MWLSSWFSWLSCLRSRLFARGLTPRHESLRGQPPSRSADSRCDCDGCGHVRFFSRGPFTHLCRAERECKSAKMALPPAQTTVLSFRFWSERKRGFGLPLLEALRPMQGHSASPATSTTHQLVAQPRKVREGCVTTVFSHRMISRSCSTENKVSPPTTATVPRRRIRRAFPDFTSPLTTNEQTYRR